MTIIIIIMDKLMHYALCVYNYQHAYIIMTMCHHAFGFFGLPAQLFGSSVRLFYAGSIEN